ncbi:phage portal protein [Macrococcoides caseolyticum]|uniref:phage portal protein n=1 Tax=Macrococcoides caseolyticum TaxID=69966 RepID=UPI000C346DFC|nr:phage portal protein [Macrococcus caseolyticus]PKE66229.1 phage portal protein [Macrococcus caseolyticus]
MLFSSKKSLNVNNEIYTSSQNWFNTMFNSDISSKITEDTAIKTSEVYTCIKVLADDIAKYPISVKQKTNNKLTTEHTHPVHICLNKQPNKNMTPFVWKRLMIFHMMLYGNAYNVIMRNNKGEVTEILPLSPLTTSKQYDRDNAKYVYFTTLNGKHYKIDTDDVLHFLELSFDGHVGLSPIEVIRENLATNIGGNKHQAKFYQKSAIPRGILKTTEIVSPENKKKLREAWYEVNNEEDVAIMDAGLDFSTITIPQKDAQFIESMKFNKLQIAGIYKVPPHKIGELDRATFSNIEQQSLQYVINTILPIVTNFEQECNVKLLNIVDENENRYCKFNLEAELRGDSESRAKMYETMQRIGAYNINNILDLEDMPLLEDELGDMHFGNLNLVPLDIMREYQLSKAKGSKSDSKGGDNQNAD